VNRRIQVVLLSCAVIAGIAQVRAQDAAPEPIPKPDFQHLAALSPEHQPEPPAVTDDAEPAGILPAAQTRARGETRIGDSGLPVPRFVSLKSNEVYLREGPSPQHKVEWVYVRRGLPVEVIAEYDVWRRIRDADGVVGWVHKGMIDGRRSVLMTGSSDIAMRDAAAADGAIVAYAKPGVVARLKSCGGSFCTVEAKSIEAYVSRDRVWGVYDDETVE
jgi:SH3-like domain-containing protein